MKLNVYAKGDDLVLVDEENVSECAGLKAKGYKDSDITPEEFNAIKFAKAEDQPKILAAAKAAAKARAEAKAKEAEKAAADKAAADKAANDKK